MYPQNPCPYEGSRGFTPHTPGVDEGFTEGLRVEITWGFTNLNTYVCTVEVFMCVVHGVALGHPSTSNTIFILLFNIRKTLNTDQSVLSTDSCQ